MHWVVLSLVATICCFWLHSGIFFEAPASGLGSFHLSEQFAILMCIYHYSSNSPHPYDCH
jgi:hypothetical protein